MILTSVWERSADALNITSDLVFFVGQLAGGYADWGRVDVYRRRRYLQLAVDAPALETAVKSKWAAAYMALHAHTSSPFL